MNDWITRFLADNFNLELSGEPVGRWLLAVSVAVVAFLVLRLVVGLAGRRLAAVAPRTDTPIDDGIASLVKKTKWWLLLVVALFAGSVLVELPERSRTLVHNVVVIALLLQLGIWASTALKFTLEHYRQRQLKKDPASVTAVNAIGLLATALLWLAILLLALDNLGFNVTALIAGLGVGGVAVALAVQNILGDLFASLSILIDKPFVVGDFLIIDDYMGSVEHVGLKTTRVRSLSGEQLVFSNSDLLNSRLAQLRPHVRASRRLHHRRDLPDPARAIEADSRHHACGDRGAGAHPLRPFPLRQIRRFFAELRNRVLRAGTRLQPLHGYPAGHQSVRTRAVRTGRYRIRLPHPDAVRAA